MMTVKQETAKLKEVRKLLANPKRWCKKEFARNKYGKQTTPCSYDAYSWCLSGACMKVTNNDDFEFSNLISRLYKVLPSNFNLLHTYNDNRSHRSIIRLLDKAITIKEI